MARSTWVGGRGRRFAENHIGTRGIEALEQRVMLSEGELSIDARLMLPPLGQRIELTEPLVPARSARLREGRDAGDFYWADGQKIPLLRAVDEVVVRLKSPEPERILQGLTGPAGALAGFRVSRSLEADIFTLKANTARGEVPRAVLEAIGNSPDVAWAVPAFLAGESRASLWVTDEIIVALKGGARAQDFFGGEFTGYRRLLGTTDQYVATVKGGGGLPVLAMADQLLSDDRVAWASPNLYQLAEPAAAPNDPLYGNQWNMSNTGQTGARVDADANLTEAWDVTTGSSDFVVAVIDDGIQRNHPDLQSSIFVNSGEIADNQADDDQNGYPDDVSGWDFYDWDINPDPDEYDKHGTAVTGVAAAFGNNSLGVSGASQRAKILPIRAFETDDEGDWLSNTERLVQAIYYAAGANASGQRTWRGADILNLSWKMDPPDTGVTQAITWAATHGRNELGMSVFIATGNDASGYEAIPTGPVQAWSSTWSWVMAYQKDGATTAGNDTVWLGQFQNSDGNITRFDTQQAPQGWNLAPFVGEDGWFIQNDPGHAWGTGRYQARSAAIGNNDTAFIMGPAFAVGGATIPSATATLWQSSDVGDTVQFYLWDWATNDLYPVFGLAGQDTDTTAPVAYPASLSSSVAGVCAVGASTDWDYRADYSQYGTGLDFVAPSSGGFGRVYTTDRTGEAGYNATGTNDPGYDPLADTNYTSTFGGTSAAAPLAAGIGALLLSRAPALSADQIRRIMHASADKIGQVTYDANGFNQYYGYGRVDARTALDHIAMVTGTAGNDIIRLVRNSVDPTKTDVYINSQNPVYSLVWSNYTVINIEGLGGNDTVTLDFYFGTFLPSGGASFDGGEGTDTLILNGTSTADNVTVRAATAVFGPVSTGTPISYKNVETVQADLQQAGDTLTVELPPSGTLPNISYDGYGGTDVLTISGSTAGDSLTANASSFTFGTKTITYSRVETVQVNLGDGNDNLTIGAAIQFPINLGNGDDTLIIEAAMQGAAKSLPVDGGAGSDTLLVKGSAGADAATFNKVLNGTMFVSYGATTPSTINHSGFEALQAQLEGGDDTLTVQYWYGVPLPAGTGNSFDGGGGTNDKLIVNGTASSDTATITSTAVTLAGFTMNYSATEKIEPYLFNSDDTMTVQLPQSGTLPNVSYESDGGYGDLLTIAGSAGPDAIGFSVVGEISTVAFGASTITFNTANPEAVQINLGDGDDTLTIDSSINGATVVPTYDGGNGSDSLVLTGSAGADTITANASNVVFGGKTITYSNAENLVINAGDGADTLTQSAQPAAAVVFNCGSGADQLIIDAGTYTFNANTTTNLSVSVSAGANLAINTTLELESLSVSGTAAMSSNGGRVLVLNALTIAGSSGSYTGLLDLADNDMIIRSNAANAVSDWERITAYIRCARNSAANRWEGMGLSSSTAADDASHLTGLGILLNRTTGGSAVHPTFDGYQVDANCILVKYSWNGDMDLNGVVNTLDYARIDAGFLSGGVLYGYQNGDLDYSGAINTLDYAIIDAAFLGQGGVVL